jgi:hypothetical protein
MVKAASANLPLANILSAKYRTTMAMALLPKSFIFGAVSEKCRTDGKKSIGL